MGVGKAAGVELLGLPLVLLSVVCEGFCAGARVLNHAMLEGVRRVVVALASEDKRAADIHAPVEEQVVDGERLSSFSWASLQPPRHDMT